MSELIPTTLIPKMLTIQGFIQHYAWGKPFESSIIPQLFPLSSSSLDHSKVFAELWFGTHPKGHSTIPSHSITLRKYIGHDLPFLFKVLSVNQPLSIQAHPDKPKAKILHSKFPHLYPDPNHKPEMVIALTPFEVLCHFRPSNEIIFYLNNVKSFRSLFDKTTVENFISTPNSKTLSNLFLSLLSLSSNQIDLSLKILAEDIVSSTSISSLSSLLNTLSSLYPSDPMVFAPFLLNHLKLEPGQSLFLSANVPHCYLFGECLEIMSCSDNVVRAGLTPKYIDKDTLSSMLTYKMTHPDISSGVNLLSSPSSFFLLYSPPIEIDEFSLYILSLHSSNSPITLVIPEHTILLVLEGEGYIHKSFTTTLKKGIALLLTPDNFAFSTFFNLKIVLATSSSKITIE